MGIFWLGVALSVGAAFGLLLGGLLAAAANADRIAARLELEDDDEDEPSLCERCDGWGLIPRRDELDECRACQGTGEQPHD